MPLGEDHVTLHLRPGRTKQHRANAGQTGDDGDSSKRRVCDAHDRIDGNLGDVRAPINHHAF